MRGESTAHPLESRGSSVSRTAAMEALRQRLATPFPTAATQPQSTESADEPATREDDEAERTPVATLGHVLTNVVILYEFLLELSAVVQARGSLFEEAGYL